MVLSERLVERQWGPANPSNDGAGIALAHAYRVRVSKARGPLARRRAHNPSACQPLAQHTFTTEGEQHG